MRHPRGWAGCGGISTPAVKRQHLPPVMHTRHTPLLLLMSHPAAGGGVTIGPVKHHHRASLLECCTARGTPPTVCLISARSAAQHRLLPGLPPSN